MRRYSYPATIQPDEDGFMVEFDDLIGVTWGATREVALREAQDLLVTSLSICVDEGKVTPVPGEANGRPIVSVTVLEAVKLALHDAMIEQGIDNAELGRRLGMDEKQIDRLRNPLRFTNIDTAETALRAVGRRLVVDVVEAA